MRFSDDEYGEQSVGEPAVLLLLEPPLRDNTIDLRIYLLEFFVCLCLPIGGDGGDEDENDGESTLLLEPLRPRDVVDSSGANELMVL